MSIKKVFRVVVIADLSERESQMLASAARLTSTRARSYVFEPLSSAAPDIYLVDADHPASREKWHLARAKHQAPTVFLKTDDQPSTGELEFRRPIVPSRLLNLVNLLDQVTVQELQFLPELCIGQEMAPADITIAGGAARGTRFSALVVDDSPTVRAQVGLGLKLFGVTASFCENGEDALEMIAKHSYDIAFLDVVLPGIDGYQICKAIKKDSRKKRTVVVMLTGKTSPFDRVKASLAGCDTFLTKPVQNTVFQEVLAKYLGSGARQDASTTTRRPLLAK